MLLCPWFIPNTSKYKLYNGILYGIDLISILPKGIKSIYAEIIVEDTSNNAIFECHSNFGNYTGLRTKTLSMTKGDFEKYSVNKIKSIKLIWNINILKIFNDKNQIQWIT